MTEHFEEIEEDEYGLEDEIDELTERLEEQEEVAEINAVIRSMERAHGSQFSNNEAQQIGELLDQGYDAESVYEHVAPSTPGGEQFNAEWLETVEHIQEQQGRPLAESELRKLYESATYEADPRHVEDGAVRDMSNREDRIAHVNERIHVPEEPPETVEQLDENAGPKERAAFIDARLAGAEIEATDTYETEGEEQ